jgi:2',3'-cyclic-nucleotide 2'-phosphodiesterase (5'-nucleotidase family)
VKVFLNGTELDIFSGCQVKDVVRKYSNAVYKEVLAGSKIVVDKHNNQVLLDGEITGGESLFIKTKKGKGFSIWINSIIFLIILSLLLLFICSLNGCKSTVISDKETKIVIFHTNDVHGELDNFSKIAEILREEREKNPNVFLFNAGDNFSGNPFVDQYDPKGEPMLEFMNMIKFDVMTMGNHEFDYGQKILNSFIRRADFRVICANMEVIDSIIPKIQPYTLFKTKNGIKIALLGLIQIEEDTGIPSTNRKNVKGIRFQKPVEAAKKYRYLKKQSDIFMALTHIGYEKDKLLAQEVAELDIIIGGHSHTVIENPVEINGVLITQAGDNNSFLGRVEITLKGGKVVRKIGKLIDLQTVDTEDAKIKKMISSIQSSPILNKVITQLNGSLQGRRELGNFITDAIRERFDLDVAIYNNGGIRIDKLDGEVRLKDIYALHPFGNYVVEIKMTPSEIEDFLRYDYIRHKSLDLQVSGIKYTIRINENNKILGIDITKENGEELLEDKEYRVGTNNYILSSYKFRHKDPGKSLQVKVSDIVIDILTKGIDVQKYKNLFRTRAVIDKEEKN